MSRRSQYAELVHKKTSYYNNLNTYIWFFQLMISIAFALT